MTTKAAAVETTPEVVFSDNEGTLAYLPFSNILVNLAADKPARRPKSPVEKENYLGNGDFMPWGDSNDLPNIIRDLVRKNTLIHPVLSVCANRMAAAGMQYGYLEGFDAKSRKPIITPFVHPDIEDFLDRNNLQLYLQDVYRNLYWWHHAYVDLYLNPTKGVVWAFSSEDSMHCRYSIQNKQTGNKDYVLIDANFGIAHGGSKETWTKVRCIDPYFDRIGQMKTYTDDYFIYPLFFNSPGNTYYQETPWHSIIASKWLELAEKIPVFKTKLMDNQMHIKYVMHIPSDYWENDNADWKKLSQDEKAAYKKAKVVEFNKVLTGVDNAGKTLALQFTSGSYEKKYGQWTIQEMKGTMGTGEYLEDSQEASDHILFALAFDGTLIGKTPGKGMGAGSGSDKRLADEIFFKNNKPYALKAAEPLDVITMYNKWRGPAGQKIVWFQEEQILTTLNNVTPANRP